MSPDRRPDDFNEAEKNAPNPVVEALAIWRETWQATPLERWNRLNLWSTMRDAARARRLLAEIDERAFCRGALEEVGFEAKKRRDLTAELAANPELAARLDDLIEASSASETAPTLAELRAVWNLSTSAETPDADASDATGDASKSDENAESFPQTRANSEILYGGAGVGRSFTDESGAIPKSSARPLEPGDVVVLSDDYEIKRIAGKGGQKAVYEVVSKRLGTRFAVKELLSELGGSEARRRDLEREVKIQARLQHQGIPKVFALTPDADPTSDGLPRFVETYVEGEPWSARPFDRAHFEENLDILLQVAKIMAYAHDRGVVHRDLKPENVMLGRYGELYVVDWGLAFDLNEEGPKTGAVGTQAYLPPEQALRLPVDKRADVFTLGGILYKILTGFAPYEIAQRTQGNAVAARKAQACDFAPLDPEAAKAELLKLAEETLTSPDASAESRAFAEKAVYVVASPSEILTFAEKGLVEISTLESAAETYSDVVVEELRQIAAEALSSLDSSDKLRRLAETALIAATPVSKKLRDIVVAALTPNPSGRFQDATAFVKALETYRPQNEELTRLEELKHQFDSIKLLLNQEITKANRIELMPYFNQGALILSELCELRLMVSKTDFVDLNARRQTLQNIYNAEFAMRCYLIDKALQFFYFKQARQLVAEQRDAIQEFVYDAGDEAPKANVEQTLQKQIAQLETHIRAPKDKTPSELFLFLIGLIGISTFAKLFAFLWLLFAVCVVAFIIWSMVKFFTALGFADAVNTDREKLRQENRDLRANASETMARNERLRRENERLRRENERLRRELASRG